MNQIKNYFVMLNQIRLYGFIASKEIEKSEFKSVCPYILSYTHSYSLDTLKKNHYGDINTFSNKYLSYIQYKVLSIYKWNKILYDFKKSNEFNKKYNTNNSYLVRQMEILTLKNYDKMRLKNCDLSAQKSINRHRNIFKECFDFVD